MGAMTTIRMALSGQPAAVTRAAFETAHVIDARDGTRTINFRTMIPIEGPETWEAMRAAWGCRSLGWDYEVHTCSGETLEFTFDIKGGSATAEPILREIARRHPSLIGTVAMVTDSEEFSAHGLLYQGRLISFQKHPWTEAMFELVVGHPYGEWPEEAA